MRLDQVTLIGILRLRLSFALLSSILAEDDNAFQLDGFLQQ
jgi:hypothetical protein